MSGINNDSHNSVDNAPVDSTRPADRQEEMQETFDKMIEMQRMQQVFSMNVNIAKASHDARMEAIRKTGQ